MTDIRQSKEYKKYLEKVGWIAENVGGVNYFFKKFLFFGSIMKVQRPPSIDPIAINALVSKYRVFQIIIEPLNDSQLKSVTRLGLKASGSPYLSTKTLCLNLNLSKDRLMDQLKSDARSAIKRNKTTNFKTYSVDDILEFRNLWTMAVGWKRYVPPLKHLEVLKNTFGKNALFIADKNSSSGAIFLKSGKTVYYWQAFTDSVGRSTQIQYKIVWQGILWGKKNKAKIFDFEGIYDNRFPNKSWLGFTHFKKSFGGKEISFPGAFTKLLIPFSI